MTQERGLTEISDSILTLADTCNVYAIRRGNRCLLVDAGSAAVLGHLDAMGVKKVEWVLHTHHHRDQCQGDHLLPEDTRIAVPQHERPLFEDAENFWRNKQIYDSYNDQSTYFTITRNIRVDESLVDYESFAWHDLEFYVLPSIGHTHGSITLLSQIDGRKVAFTGDMIHSKGRVLSLTELQHSYGGPEGVDLNSFSLRDLAHEKPDLLLPSHGEPMENPAGCISETIGSLREYHDYLTGQPLTIDRTFKELSPHLLTAPHACCTPYVILSDSGKALLVDYGAASPNHFYAHLRQFESWELQRFVEHSIRELKEEHNVREIEVVIPTHYHDDHTCGIPHLTRKHGVELWALEEMVNILENPHEYNVPCLLPYSMKVDRSIRDGEKVRWEEYEMEVVHFPGQTEYHMAMAVEIDGKRVAFTGDSLGDGGETLVQPIVHRNIVTPESHEKCAEKLLQLRPDVIAHGHGGWFEVDRQKILTLRTRARRTREFFENLVPPPAATGVNPAWTRLVPYQSCTPPGGELEMELEVHNYFGESLVVDSSLVLPDEWDVSPPCVEIEIPPREARRASFVVRAGNTPGRFGIAGDLTVNGRRLGQLVEAIVRIHAGR